MMPPRHVYWTIIVDDQPTSFRAHDVEELLPTFNRLREKHPNAQLKWFERGQLWESRDAARAQGFGQGERRWEGPRPARDAEPGEPPRDRNWRPGGEHRDPRQKYKDAKKAKWDRYKQNIRARWDEKQPDRPVPDEGDFTPPHGDPIRRNVGQPRAFDQRPARSDQQSGRGESGPNKPHGDPLRRDRGWKPKPEGGWRRDDRRSAKPFDRDQRDRPPRRDFRRDQDRNDRFPERRDKDERPPFDRERRPADRDRKPAGKPWGKKPGGYGNKPGGGFGKKPGGAGARSGGFGAKSTGGFGKKKFGSSSFDRSGQGPSTPAGRSGHGKKTGGFRKPSSGGPPRGPRGPRKRRDDDE